MKKYVAIINTNNGSTYVLTDENMEGIQIQVKSFINEEGIILTNENISDYPTINNFFRDSEGTVVILEVGTMFQLSWAYKVVC